MSVDELESLRSENAELKSKVKNLEHILYAKGIKGKSKGKSALEYILIAFAVGFALIVAMPLLADNISSKFENIASSLE